MSGSVRPDQRSPLIGRPDRGCGSASGRVGSWRLPETCTARPRRRPARCHRLHRCAHRGVPRRARARRAALGAGRPQPQQAGGGARQARDDRPRARRPRADRGRQRRPRLPRRDGRRAHQGRDLDGRALRAVRRAAGRRVRRGRHRLRRPHRRAGVRGPDVRRLPRDRREVRRPDRALLRLRLDPARPRRLLHGQGAGREGPVAVRGVVRAGAMVSGGTFHSAMGIMSRARETREAAKARRAVERRPEGRSSKAVAGKPHRDKVLGWWLLPLPTIDPTVVARSGAALAAYGPGLHLLPLRRRQEAVERRRRRARRPARHGRGPGAAAAQLPARPDQAGRRARRGPPRQVVVHASTSSARATAGPCTPGSVAATRATARPSKMLAESALCLAFDDNPKTAGQRHHRPGDGRQPDGPPGGGGHRFETL